MADFKGINFPTSPSIGQSFYQTVSGIEYTFTGGDPQLVGNWKVTQTGQDSSVMQISDADNPAIKVNVIASGTGEGGKLRTSSKSFLYDIAEGLVLGHSGKRNDGFCPDVDNVEITVWPGPASMYVFPTAGMQMEVVSSSINDAASGSGIQKVMIHYLDTEFHEYTEEITLNGTTPVSTVATNIYRVNCLHALQAGATGSAEGNIDIRHLTDTPVYSRIQTGRTVCQSSVFTISDGSNSAAYITSWHASIGAASVGHYGIFRLRATTSPMETMIPGLFFLVDTVIQQDSSVFIPLEFPYKLLPGTDIMVTVVSDGALANAIATAAYTFYIEPK